MPAGVTRRDLELISTIYDAAVDPAAWPAVLEKLAGTVDAAASAIFATDPNSDEFSVEAVSSRS